MPPGGKSEGKCSAFLHLAGTCWLVTPPTKVRGVGLIVGKSGHALGRQATWGLSTATFKLPSLEQSLGWHLFPLEAFRAV